MSGHEPSVIAGRYQVVRRLGSGAFGTVYEAKDSVLGRPVAIKVIRAETLAAAGDRAPELLERFRREARVSAQLRHPNVVTIYDVGEAQEISYLAMELIGGETLNEVIARSGRLEVTRSAALAAQVAEALGYAHGMGVVHRDVKPANIMVEPGDRVKVTDFGIAKAQTAEQLTTTGTLIGTPAYMSPEQARGEELDGRSDLFSLGCVLYEMLTGQRAFQGDSITGLIFKVISEQPAPVRSLAPEVPAELARLVDRALRKQPGGRPGSGAQLARELIAFANPDSIPTVLQRDVATVPHPARQRAETPPAATAERTASIVRAPDRRSRVPLAMAALALLAAIVGLAVLRRDRAGATGDGSLPPTATATAIPAVEPSAAASPAAEPPAVPPREPRSQPNPHVAATEPAPGDGLPPLPRRPTDVSGQELAGWRTVRAIMEAERRYHADHGRYGGWSELSAGRYVPDARDRRLQVARRIYTFDVSASATGFEIVASPKLHKRGLRSFVGDGSWTIRAR